MKNVELSERMSALVKMVTKGRIVCDVGCDHGFVSIYLVQQGIAPKVFAMDVRSGPLESAKEHIAEYHLEPYIEPRLSDGLKELQAGEADCMICAGMGGPLMEKILREGRTKARAMRELILQPQSEISRFRKFLRMENYEVVQEDMVFEEGKYYPMMKVIPLDCTERMEDSLIEEQELYDAFGELLLKQKHPILKQYLSFSVEKTQQIMQHLKEQETLRAEERIAELQKELDLLYKAQNYM